MDSVTGEILWESSDHPSDTVMSDTKGPHVYTSWKSDNDPSPGNFVLAFAPRPPLQFFIWRGSTPYWRSGPWDKSRFIGIPEMDTSISGATVKDSQVPGSLSVSLGRFSNCSLKNLFISYQGYVKFMCWENNYGWYADWEAPRSPCDIYGACGPFGFCKTSKRPLNCFCMRGFVPKSREEWSKGNWTRGCVRRTTLLCERNSSAIAAQAGKADGFWQMRGVRLPDFSYYVDEVAEGCQRWCQDNCSCTGYSYVNGIGCQVWTRDLIDVIEFSYGGQDLFIRLTHDELGKGKPVKFITILIAISTFAVLTAILYALYKWRANQNRKVKHEDIKANDQLELPMLDFDGILVATNHFNLTNKLGQGGYGPVYKGRLQDGKDVAIKRLSSSSGQGVEEFKNEMTLISKLQHRNLVKLVGCCIEREEKILVYEFLSNKSLDTHLFDPIKKANLNWTIRYNIIKGIGRGLLYLHRDSCLRVIHRDLKVSNILLDEKMNPKISDFGLARIFQGTHGLANTNRVVGTLGYMAPEYALGGIFSDKSDVFSFGILLLEIVSSKKINDFHCEEQHLGLISYAWQSWCESRGINMVDEALAESFSQSEVIRCVNIGLLCVQDHAADRPTMAAIVSMLSGEAKLPQPKQPTFTFQSILQSENRAFCKIKLKKKNIS
ncbi:G-type lectin S-receptor-like serine/threonine-protein kinase At1g61370 [Manihot esculenta]|uniref:G-type lectin S-receptor-like serine/threonine-protein kinase At1g61370 n=1 Tax=Manihot esculenta TaxID=3983 RepID=UPI001CC7D7B1|nr:G-type lectin S-receptor-like serine/threonine-protein kinase At1g61370 [Manihot esculenta]